MMKNRASSKHVARCFMLARLIGWSKPYGDELPHVQLSPYLFVGVRGVKAPLPTLTVVDIRCQLTVTTDSTLLQGTSRLPPSWKGSRLVSGHLDAARLEGVGVPAIVKPGKHVVHVAVARLRRER
jgi:hypothetical protein